MRPLEIIEPINVSLLKKLVAVMLQQDGTLQTLELVAFGVVCRLDVDEPVSSSNAHLRLDGFVLEKGTGCFETPLQLETESLKFLGYAPAGVDYEVFLRESIEEIRESCGWLGSGDPEMN